MIRPRIARLPNPPAARRARRGSDEQQLAYYQHEASRGGWSLFVPIVTTVGYV